MSSNNITTLNSQKDTNFWLPFLLTILLSGLFAFMNLSEYVNVGILNKVGGYPFGAEGPTSWHYKTKELYSTVSLIYGLLFLIAFSVSLWTLIKFRMKAIFITFLSTISLIVIQIITGQST